MSTETERARALRSALHELVDDVTEPPNALANLRLDLRSGPRPVPEHRRWVRPRVLVPVAAAAVLAAVAGGVLLPNHPATAPPTGQAIAPPTAPLVVLAAARRSTPPPATAAVLNQCVAATEEQIREGQAHGVGMVPVPATGWHADAVLGANSDEGILVAHNDNGDIGGCTIDHGNGLGIQASPGGAVPAGKVFTIEFGSGGPAGEIQAGGRISANVSRVEIGTKQGKPLHTDVQVALGQNSWAVKIGKLTSGEAASMVLRFYDTSGRLVYSGPLSYT